MFKHSCFTSCILAVVAVVLISSSSFAESEDFTPESFIPDKFVDTEWRLSGDIRLNGNNEQSDQDMLPSVGYESEQTESETDNQRFSLFSSWERRYRSIPSFLDMLVRWQGTYEHSSRSSDRFNSDNPTTPFPPLGRRTSYLTSSLSDRYVTDLAAITDAGTYLKGDWFMSVRLNSSYRYMTLPKSESANQRITTDTDSASSLRDIDESLRKSEYDQHNYFIDFEAMPGWGRTYAADYAVTAMYIIDELSREDLVSSQPTKEQMLHLAEKIYYYRLKHAVDNRLLRIETFSEILEYLQSEQIVADPGTKAQAVIADVWNYFPGSGRAGIVSREFGYRIRAGAGLNFVKSSQDRIEIDEDFRLTTVYYTATDLEDTLYIYEDLDRDEIDETSTTRESFLTCETEYHKPVSLKSQLDLWAQAWYMLDSYYASSSKHTSDPLAPVETTREYRRDSEDKYRLAAFGQYSYFLNSRTDMSFFGEILYTHSKDTETNKYATDAGYSESSITDDSSNWDWSLSGQVRYRLAIPTTLTLRADYRNGDYALRYVYPTATVDHIYDRSDYSISLGISHYLM